MFKSKLAVLCLSLTATVFCLSDPAGAHVLFPGHRDFQDGVEMFSSGESLSDAGIATAIRTYRGGYGHTVIPTSSGAIMAGTYGAGGFECCDPWLVWLDSHGNPIRKLIYDSDELAGANNIQATSDGGLIMSIEGQNMMAVKLDTDGYVEWAKSYGEGGYTLARIYVTSEDDYLVVWEKTYGGSYEEQATMVTRIRDRFYVVVGSTDSFTGGGMRNFWTLVITETGTVVWERSLGGSDADVPYTVIETSDGGVLIGGGTGSFGAGSSDIWLVKFDARGQIDWQKTYGLYRTEHAWHVRELPSGGYVVVGDSYEYPVTYDVWLMAIDENGNVQFGNCGDVGDTFVTPIQTHTAIQSPTTPVINKDMRVVDISVNVVEQTLPIEDCTPWEE
jgi:hypothetical protein